MDPCRDVDRNGGAHPSSPNPGTDNELTGVSCTDSAHCLAVGNYYLGTSGNEQTLIEAWDGTDWPWFPVPT